MFLPASPCTSPTTGTKRALDPPMTPTLSSYVLIHSLSHSLKQTRRELDPPTTPTLSSYVLFPHSLKLETEFHPVEPSKGIFLHKDWNIQLMPPIFILLLRTHHTFGRVYFPFCFCRNYCFNSPKSL